jgi:light-independent protochlorophyllide reductase subunit N
MCVILNYSGSGIETTFTQGEDACLHRWCRRLPQAASDAPRTCWSPGALADVVEDQFTRCFNGLGIDNVHFLPARARR